MLEVNYKACAPNAKLREDSRLQEALGIYLMVLGVPELTTKTLPGALLRLRFYLQLSNDGNCYDQVANMFRDGLGVKCNIAPKTRAQFCKTQIDWFWREHG